MTPDQHGLTRVPIAFVNAYLASAGDGWMLVDTGLAGAAPLIRRAVEQRFGPNARPRAIVLTHGHFDHAGSARRLAQAWDLPVYAHRREMAYLTGRSAYPPPDPTVGGALAAMSRVFPRGPLDLKPYVQALPEDGSIPGIDGWRVIETPGHTPGHVSLFRESDGVLIAGDALATMDQESWTEQVVQRRQLRWPPAPLTTDWQAARRSLETLAGLRPHVLAAGHGRPVHGDGVAAALEAFAREFAPPAHGRYVLRPALADDLGVVQVPPAVADPVGRRLRAGVVAGTVLAGLAIVNRVRARA